MPIPKRISHNITAKTGCCKEISTTRTISCNLAREL